ncbi:uncharacterized protein DSM5745_01022 [Aspergillus mulundensis]|uniref:FAD-binding domain-containing protein n=1 Tax=Aspergillus mulundensis TaxID=1810919 RepID=A0A3D8T576_9EURO|nr:hypothetical protein DSM5745_01022 [Aspergillus mulundensis]RDW93700.1 hypothetical protein DSM5745_01022 [Aspergillus mulundensis]
MSIIIIGGGPTALLTSIYLSTYKIPHTLFDQRPGGAPEPALITLNFRTMEILRALKLEDAVLAAAAPPSRTKVAWYTNLGANGREIFTRDALGGGIYEEEYAYYSPCRTAHLSQAQLEGILLQRARELNPTGICSAEVLALGEDAEGVTVTVRHGDSMNPDAAAGEIRTCRASYAIAAEAEADGARIAPALGIAMSMSGEEDIMEIDLVSVHFRAPLSLVHDPNVLVASFIDPARGASGTLTQLGPYPCANPDAEEWLLSWAVHPHAPKPDSNEILHRLVRTLDLPPSLLSRMRPLRTTHKRVSPLVADHYHSAQGRIFLVGASAHRIPDAPGGGSGTGSGSIGANTTFQDVQNLAWKLALTLRNPGQMQHTLPNNLLSTYEAERRPIALRVAGDCVSDWRRHAGVSAMDRALGVYPAQTVEENVASLNAYFEPSHPLHAQRRQAVLDAQGVLDRGLHAPGTEGGWFYETDITSVSHGAQVNENSFDVHRYHVFPEEGHHLPHFWVRRREFTRSSRKLIRTDKLVLLAKDRRWSGFKREVDEVDVEILKGGLECWRDVHGAWEGLGLEADEALLVRPDGVIAWRLDGSYLGSTEYFAKVVTREVLRYYNN